VRLTVTTDLATELEKGASVAVDGVCLTATEVTPTSFQADVMAETLKRTILDGVSEGADVNLELPPRAVDRLGGHLVQGHIDGVGSVNEVVDQGIARLVTFRIPVELVRYVVPQGSIAVNGVSLTVVDVGDSWFSVALIPETLTRTNLGEAVAGTRVNIEVDVFAKYIEKLVAGSRLSLSNSA
jgi:riboflavin synthase